MGYCYIRVRLYFPFMRRRSGFEGKAVASSSAGTLPRVPRWEQRWTANVARARGLGSRPSERDNIPQQKQVVRS
jgi:hypothetical protein